MFTTIITDCTSENAKGRQESRFLSLGLGPVSFVGVNSNLGKKPTLEAGGNLVDILDATEGKRGIVVVNVAPRGDKKDGENGTNFCYFHYKNTLIVSTTKGYALSFVKQLKLVEQINIFETENVLKWAISNNLIGGNLANYIKNSQFRSFDFVPRVSKWISESHVPPSTILSLQSIPSIPPCVWYIDAFGNVKLTLANIELPLRGNPLKVRTNLGEFSYYEKLKDIPKGETAIYTGSSGIRDIRFLEIATQGVPGSAAKKLKLSPGDRIEIASV